MMKVKKLEQEVEKLNRSELAAFRKWFQAYDSERWDREIEGDVRAGRLEKLAKEALAAHKVGKSKEL
jgi:hypothetical protein